MVKWYFVLLGVLILHSDIKAEQPVLLSEKALCGPKSLNYIAKIFGQKTDVNELAKKANCTEKGCSLLDLKKTAEALGFKAQGYKIEVSQLKELSLPGIILIHDNHFVVLEKVLGESVKMVDSPWPPYEITKEKLAKIWRGEILIISLESKVKRNAGELVVTSEPFHEEPSDVIAGEKVSHTFRLKNVGQGELKLSDLQTSCFCTKANLNKPVLAPGEEAKLAITIDTTGLFHHLSYSAIVKTSDPLVSLAKFSLGGNIQTDLQIKPSDIFFGNVIQEEQVIRKAWIILPQKFDKTHDVIQLTSDSTNIVTAINFEKENVALANFSLQARQEVGEIKGELELKILINKNEKIVKIPYQGEIVSDIYTTPSLLFLGICHLKEKKSFSVIITSRKQNLFKLIDIKNAIPGMIIKSSTFGQEQKMHQLECLFEASNIVDISTSFEVLLENKGKRISLNVPVVGKVE